MKQINKESLVAFRLPFVLQLLLAEEIINFLQAKTLDFPLICDYLSKRFVMLDQVNHFNYQQLHAVENWLSHQYLSKIPTFTDCLKKLMSPQFYQALCFPTIFKMYDKGDLDDRVLSLMTENHCLTLIINPVLQEIIIHHPQVLSAFLDSPVSALKNLQTMSATDILSLHFINGPQPQVLSISDASLEHHAELFTAGVISKNAFFSEIELMIISSWFFYGRNLDFETLVNKLVIFKNHECFRYTFAFTLFFKDKLIEFNQENLGRMQESFEYFETDLYEHWDEHYETLYFPLMNAKVFSFQNYLDFLAEEKEHMMSLTGDQQTFFSLIRHEFTINEWLNLQNTGTCSFGSF